MGTLHDEQPPFDQHLNNAHESLLYTFYFSPYLILISFGKIKVNVVPSPTLLDTLILP